MEKNKKTKILIIEDDTYISDMYKIKLKTDGFEVAAASDGMEGMKLLEEQMPDIILLDIVMPKIDGFNVLKMIKSNERFAKIPVVLLTNLGQKENIKRGLKLGAASYIIKAHFTPSEVVKKIKDILKENKKL